MEISTQYNIAHALNSYADDKGAPKRVVDKNAIKVKDAKASGDKTGEKKAPLARDKQTDRVEKRGEQAAARDLKDREQKVTAHESAHTAAGGAVTGAPSYTYTRGPDGNTYISGGEVSIDTSGGSTPQETIEKMRKVRAAALAPADPSAQDRAIAARATKIEAAARMEAVEEEKRAEESSAQDTKEAIAAPVNEYKKGEVKEPENRIRTVQERQPTKRISIFA